MSAPSNGAMQTVVGCRRVAVHLDWLQFAADVAVAVAVAVSVGCMIMKCSRRDTV